MWRMFVRRAAKRRVRVLLEALSDNLAPAELANAIDYVEHNEWGLGMEYALDTLDNRGTAIPEHLARTVTDLCELMKIEDRWTAK